MSITTKIYLDLIVKKTNCIYSNPPTTQLEIGIAPKWKSQTIIYVNMKLVMNCVQFQIFRMIYTRTFHNGVRKKSIGGKYLMRYKIDWNTL